MGVARTTPEERKARAAERRKRWRVAHPDYQNNWAKRNRKAASAATARWRIANHERFLELQKKSLVKRRTKVGEEVDRIKAGRGCILCGLTDPICLDCHHRDPGTKRFDVARAVNGGWPLNRVLGEIEKCEVVCSNCHRKIHAGTAALPTNAEAA